MDEHDAAQPGELEALRDLIKHPGWVLFRENAKKTWGPEGYGLQMRAALGSIPTGPDRTYELARIAEQVESTAKAVDVIVAWPAEQIRRLTAAPAPQGISRWRRSPR